MTELSKDEIRADAILDAATPPPSEETSFPEISKKKPAVRKAPVKKAGTVAKKVAAAPLPEVITPISPEVEKPAPAVIPAKKAPASNDAFKKSWQKINSWGLGISGKVIILLIVIGIFSEIVGRF